MEFSLKRLSFLLKLDYKNILANTTLKVLAVIAFIFVIINVTEIYFSEQHDNGQFLNQFVMFLLISSVVVGTLVYIEMSKSPNRISYLNLPGSTLEKTVSKFVISMIVFPIAMLIYYTIGFYIVKLTSMVITDKPMVLNYLSSRNIQNFETVLHISLVILSIFAYGSIRYNNASFIKLILRIFTIIAITGFISFIIALILLPPVRGEVFGLPYDKLVLQNEHSIGENHWSYKLAEFAFFYMTIPVFWVMSFFSLKEKQA